MAGVLDDAYVATDDERIEAAVKAFGGKVVMTSVHHKSGTDRCYEACTKVGEGFDVVVNIQGDEPFIQPSQLETVKACFDDPSTQIATLVKPLLQITVLKHWRMSNSPKVVLNKNMNALYFSRSIIPYQRNAEKWEWLKNHTLLQAYRVICLSGGSVERDNLASASLLLNWRSRWNNCAGWKTVIPLKPVLPKWRQSVLIHRKIWNMRNVSCKHETLNEYRFGDAFGQDHSAQGERH